MNIQFFIKDFKLDEAQKVQWKKLICDLIKSYADGMGLDLDFVHEAVLSDEDNYVEALKRHGDIRKFTNNDSYAKQAKTVLHRTEGGEIKASLVFRQELVEEVLSAVKEEKEKLDYTGLQAKYIICHELGHCLDLKNRYSSSLNQELTTDKFSISQMSNYFSNILLEEFAACVHSGPAITTGVFHSEVNSTSESSQQRINELESMKESYNGNPQQLFDLAVSACSIFWIIMVQYAKLIGNKINNQKVTAFKLKVQDKQSVRSLFLLNEMAKQLGELWKQYPDWKQEDYRFLMEIWYGLALENGFKFVETPEGDGVYWE